MVNAGRRKRKTQGGEEKLWSKQMTSYETNFHSQAFRDKLLDTNLLYIQFIYLSLHLLACNLSHESLIHLSFQSKRFSFFITEMNFDFISNGDMRRKFMKQDENRLIFDVFPMEKRKWIKSSLSIFCGHIWIASYKKYCLNYYRGERRTFSCIRSISLSHLKS
jgi:hypothetical protein